jgi:hypothetical protein
MSPPSSQLKSKPSKKPVESGVKLRFPEIIQVLLASLASLLNTCLAYTSTVKMNGVCSSETLSNFYWARRCYILEDRTFHIHRCEKLRSNMIQNASDMLRHSPAACVQRLDQNTCVMKMNR